MKRSASKKSRKKAKASSGKPRSSVKARALPALKGSTELGALNRDLLRSFTEFMREEGLASFVFRSEEFEVELKFAGADYIPAPAAHAPHSSHTTHSTHHAPRTIETPSSFTQTEEKRPSPATNVNSRVIKSPFVGTFYRCPAPGKPPFVEVGATVNSGDALCVLEAMKLMNEIEAEFRCKILKVLVDDASPVEYGEALFEVEAL